MTEGQLSKFYTDNNITVTGNNSIKPIFDFYHLPIDISIIDKISDQGISAPTPIQSLALPAAFVGMDILAVSETASGKTLAYCLPLVYSVRTQGKSSKGDGPTGLVLVPTRELCIQVYKELKKFASIFKLKVCALYGGIPKGTQLKELTMGTDIAIATPARLIDLVQTKSHILKKVSFLVLDEADLMFTMGFEYQVRSIIGQIRPDRQTMLFSATFRDKLETFIQEFLSNPIKIAIGSPLHSNPKVSQEIIVMEHPSKKLSWLLEKIQSFISKGLVLIFVKFKATTEELSEILKEGKIVAASLHGDMDQYSRESVVSMFSKNAIQVLVATDIVSRGLNIPSINTIINYECARDIETHIHRIGRTGREDAGNSYTLLTKQDKKFAGDLLLNLEYNQHPIPEKLEALAMKDKVFRVQRMKNDRDKVRYCETGDLDAANAILAKLGTKKMDLDKTTSVQEFRDHIEGQKRDYFQQEFKQKFVNAGNLDSNVKETTVTYLEKPKKKSKWDIQ
jgi:ATP-dependent RNA helicase DDX42